MSDWSRKENASHYRVEIMKEQKEEKPHLYNLVKVVAVGSSRFRARVETVIGSSFQVASMGPAEFLAMKAEQLRKSLEAGHREVSETSPRLDVYVLRYPNPAYQGAPPSALFAQSPSEAAYVLLRRLDNASRVPEPFPDMNNRTIQINAEQVASELHTAIADMALLHLTDLETVQSLAEWIDLHESGSKRRATDAKLTLRESFLKHVNFEFVWERILRATVSGGRVRDILLKEVGLVAVPPMLDKMLSLEGIRLPHNRIATLPGWLCRSAQPLRILDLRGNRITTIPHSLLSPSGDVAIDLGANRIESLPSAILDSPLQVLYKDLRSRDSSIILDDNPLVSPPPEIIQRGKTAIARFFASSKTNARPLNAIKAVFIGDGASGKTSLVKRIRMQDFDQHEEQTHGIRIETYGVKVDGAQTDVAMWDFGGQEIMHATHQFFLSSRSLYILVLDGRKEQDAEYWLKHVKSFGGDSPVIVVINKIDENPGFDLDRERLAEKYPSILGFYRVSCKSRRGLPALRSAIQDGIAAVDIRETLWPPTWFSIRRKIESEQKPFIGHDRYTSLCEEYALTDEEEQGVLARFLHDLGIVVYFPDFDLNAMHVLDPKWLTGAVYRIINSKELARGKGVLRLSTLPKILTRKYKRETHSYIIAVMKKFELCYFIDEQTVLVPDLLEVQSPPLDGYLDTTTRMWFEYDFLPRSIIPRLIVRKSHLIKDELRWRTGVVFSDRHLGAVAVVRADHDERRIYIDVTGRRPHDLLTIVRSAIADINQTFEEIGVKAMVPLPDAPTLAVSYDHLAKLQEIGKKTYYPDGAKEPYSVAELLGAVVVEKKRTESEFLDILRRALAEDATQDEAEEKAEDIFLLQPNFAGMGIDVKVAARKAVSWVKKRDRSKKA